MKKNEIKILFIAILLGVILINIKATASLPLVGKLIVIDPGHGGIDPGTNVGELLEKDLNLQVSLVLEQTLSKKGASVLLIREGDYDLSKPNAIWRKKSDFDNRIKLINDSKADMYVSIHMNYLSASEYDGVQVFYLENNAVSEKIAKTIQVETNEKLNFDRESKSIPSETYMYPKLKINGVLIECGFLSNASEREKLQKKEYQIGLSEAITSGIIKALS